MTQRSNGLFVHNILHVLYDNGGDSLKESEAQRRAKLKYRSDKRKHIQLEYSLEEYEQIKEYCKSLNVPVATWCKSAIEKAMGVRE